MRGFGNGNNNFKQIKMENSENKVISFYNSFDREKMQNAEVLKRYVSIVQYRFFKKYGLEINDIVIAYHGDDFIKDKLTIRFQHRPGNKKLEYRVLS